MQSKTPLYNNFPFASGFYYYNLVLTKSNGKAIVAANHPERNPDTHLLSYSGTWGLSASLIPS